MTVRHFLIFFCWPLHERQGQGLGSLPRYKKWWPLLLVSCTPSSEHVSYHTLGSNRNEKEEDGQNILTKTKLLELGYRLHVIEPIHVMYLPEQKLSYYSRHKQDKNT